MTVNHRLPIHPAYRPPATRGECITGTPNTGSMEERTAGRASCRAFQCRHHLFVTTSQDVPGRRHGGLAPEWTLNGGNTSASAPSCALDMADAHPAGMSTVEIANALGLDKRRIEQILKRWRMEEGACRMLEVGKEDE